MAVHISVVLFTTALLNGFGAFAAGENCSYEGQVLERLMQTELETRQMKADAQRMRELIKKLEEKSSPPIVAFSAYNPADWTPQQGQVIVFRNVYMNVGEGYDTTYGIFTASIRGLYQFTAHFCNAPNSAIAFGIYLGDNRIAASTVVDKDYSGCGTATALTIMELRQTVTVRGDYDYNQLNDDYNRKSSFTGVLINMNMN